MTKPTLSKFHTVTPTHHKTDPLQQKDAEPTSQIHIPDINPEYSHPDSKAFLSGSPVSSQRDTPGRTKPEDYPQPTNRKPSYKTQHPLQSDRGKDNPPASTPQSPIPEADKEIEQGEIDKLDDKFDSIITPTMATHLHQRHPPPPSE